MVKKFHEEFKKSSKNLEEDFRFEVMNSYLTNYGQNAYFWTF
jgi:hypothetical protein